ncbi:hypothetical protein AMELA_G00187710 [Ameiurus melas]|uniref:Uncharacterized protein n=1 Tax=Ameiurus melas TaxID=219545 RepID=A0A7J6A865_AMEME|nr:hypothetical protein AMELA_G00187710 [Ameiurus melas]
MVDLWKIPQFPKHSGKEKAAVDHFRCRFGRRNEDAFRFPQRNVKLVDLTVGVKVTFRSHCSWPLIR